MAGLMIAPHTVVESLREKYTRLPFSMIRPDASFFCNRSVQQYVPHVLIKRARQGVLDNLAFPCYDTSISTYIRKDIFL